MDSRFDSLHLQRPGHGAPRNQRVVRSIRTLALPFSTDADRSRRSLFHSSFGDEGAEPGTSYITLAACAQHALSRGSVVRLFPLLAFSPTLSPRTDIPPLS
jgi:hypothetical protein